MLTQTNAEKAKQQHEPSWNGWTLQLIRNDDDGAFGVWAFRGRPVVMVSAAKA